MPTLDELVLELEELAVEKFDVFVLFEIVVTAFI